MSFSRSLLSTTTWSRLWSNLQARRPAGECIYICLTSFIQPVRQIGNCALSYLCSSPRGKSAAGHQLTLGRSTDTSAFVKGFGCRPHEGGAAHSGPASESLQGRKPRLRNVRRCSRLYGDLSAAGELADLDRADPTRCATVPRLRNERRLASNSTSCPTICDDG